MTGGNMADGMGWQMAGDIIWHSKVRLYSNNKTDNTALHLEAA
jgi:hypothetical protein